MAVKFTNIFHSKALPNIPKLGFLGLKINHLPTLVFTLCSSFQTMLALAEFYSCPEPGSLDGERVK
jgi:hypothetical protein